MDEVEAGAVALDWVVSVVVKDTHPAVLVVVVSVVSVVVVAVLVMAAWAKEVAVEPVVMAVAGCIHQAVLEVKAQVADLVDSVDSVALVGHTRTGEQPYYQSTSCRTLRADLLSSNTPCGWCSLQRKRCLWARLSTVDNL